MLQSRIATMNRSVQRENVRDCGSPLPLWELGRRARAAEDCHTPRPCGVPSGSWEAVSKAIRALASGITESCSWRDSASSLSHYHLNEPRGLTPVFQPESEPTGKSALPCSAASLRLVQRKQPHFGSGSKLPDSEAAGLDSIRRRCFNSHRACAPDQTSC